MTEEVMTVLGAIPANQIGITLMHEHFLADLSRKTGEPDHFLGNIKVAIEEAKHFCNAGGTTVVDVTTRGLGREPEALQEIARETGLNIVMGCGWYREPYYYHELYKKTTNQIANDIIRDVVKGVGDTKVRAGIIGEIGCHLHYIQPSEERSFRAAARAQKHTGLTITTHAVRAEVGLDILDLLSEEGVDLRRVIVGHCDTYYDSEYHEAVARRGAFVEFDTIRGKSEFDTEQRVQWIMLLVEKGYLHKILLSQDVCMKSHLRAYGGNGYDYILTSFIPRLKQAGLNNEQIQILLEKNPKSALTGI